MLISTLVFMVGCGHIDTTGVSRQRVSWKDVEGWSAGRIRPVQRLGR